MLSVDSTSYTTGHASPNEPPRRLMQSASYRPSRRTFLQAATAGVLASALGNRVGLTYRGKTPLRVPRKLALGNRVGLTHRGKTPLRVPRKLDRDPGPPQPRA